MIGLVQAVCHDCKEVINVEVPANHVGWWYFDCPSCGEPIAVWVDSKSKEPEEGEDKSK